MVHRAHTLVGPVPQLELSGEPLAASTASRKIQSLSLVGLSASVVTVNVAPVVAYACIRRSDGQADSRCQAQKHRAQEEMQVTNNVMLHVVNSTAYPCSFLYWIPINRNRNQRGGVDF
jgi:hypothetical protein